MSEKTIEWKIKITWDSAFVDDEYFILKENFAWAKDWDDVEIQDVSENPNIPNYSVVKVITETKEVIDEAIEKEKIIKWYFREGLHWNWYISITWKKGQVFVSNINTLWAKAWDKVKANLWFESWKEVAKITEIIRSKKVFHIWEVIEENWLLFVINEKNNQKIELNWKDSFNLKPLDIISFSLGKEEKIFIKEKIWEKGDIWLEILKIAAKSWIRLNFPEAVLEEAEELNWDIDSNEILKRRDLRDLFTITIDWPDSKDLDDAISIEILPDWKIKLYVHIADVTYYSEEWSELDKEASKRWNSNYYADRVTPMYPERLSNDLCSLNPNTDKLTQTCEIVFDKNWNPLLEESTVYLSVINSDFRMTYEEVDKISDSKLSLSDKLMFWSEVNNKLIELVNNSFELSDLLSDKFKDLWKLNINWSETKIVVDENKKPIWIKAYPKHKSNKVIENFMVMANNIVPQVVQKMIEEDFENLPFVHRTHWTPSDDAVDKLKNILEVLDVEFDFKDNSSKTFSSLLDSIKWHPKEKFLSKKITTTLQKAIYTAIREWHFGLALEYYSHFTSPIRRYSDTQIHRIIWEILNWTFTQERFEHYMWILPKVSEHASTQEDMSENNEKDVNKYLAIELMKDKIWEEFEWYIDDITWTKVKVIFSEVVSGILELDENKYTSIRLHEWIYEIVDNKTQNKISLWDELNMEISSVDEENQLIYLKLIK